MRRAAVVHGVLQAIQRREHVHDALAIFQRLLQQRTQRGFVFRRDNDVAHRQFQRVLAEAVQARPRVDAQEFAVDAQMRIAARLGPFGQVGIDALAVHDQRREQADVLAAMVAHELGKDRLRALRRHRRAVVDAVLHAQLHIQQPQEVPHLGRGRHRALTAAARQALLNGHRGRNAIHGIDFRPPRRLHDGACIGIERFKIAALPLVEQDVERQRRLARTRYARHDVEFAVRNVDVQALQVVLVRVDDAHDVFTLDFRQRSALGAALGQCRLQRHAFDGFRLADAGFVLLERGAGVRCSAVFDLRRRAGADQQAAGVAAFRAEVNDPIRRTYHVEVVFDHDQRMPGVE